MLQTQTFHRDAAGTAEPMPGHDEERRRPARAHLALVAVLLVVAVAAVRIGTGLSLPQAAFVAATLTTAGWWIIARQHMTSALIVCSLAVGAAAAIEIAAQGPTWQQSGWEVLAGLVAVSALWRMRRTGSTGRVGRWARGAHRTVLGATLLGCAFLAQFATVPALPTPTGMFHVGSEVFAWSDPGRQETLTATSGDVREVVAQAWYPTDTTTGHPTAYIGAGTDSALMPGLPAGFFRRYDDQTSTHAHDNVPVSHVRDQWPVLLFSPGLGVARQSYTALCTELASRGYVVVAMSHPYESPVTRLADGRPAAPRTFVPTDPSGLAQIAELVDIRAADSSFVLDQLEQLRPGSPLTGHLDLAHVGIFGHSLGGATAVRTMATDDRFLAGGNLDGRLFGDVPALRRPFLWVQSEASTTDSSEHAATQRTRDQLMDRLAAGGALVTITGSAHMSFSDTAAYVTPLGRHLVGHVPAVGLGSVPVADMTRTTADLIASVMGPALNGPDSQDLSELARRDPAVQVVPTVAPPATGPGLTTGR